MSQTNLEFHVGAFLDEHFGPSTKITLAGKNVASFDYQFLPDTIKHRFNHRMIDIGSMFIDWTKPTLPSLEQVKEKLGMDKVVAHDAYEDALDVIRVLRTTYVK